jgi:hypothetical protein
MKNKMAVFFFILPWLLRKYFWDGVIALRAKSLAIRASSAYQ